jgi:hypothetical protein
MSVIFSNEKFIHTDNAEKTVIRPALERLKNNVSDYIKRYDVQYFFLEPPSGYVVHHHHYHPYHHWYYRPTYCSFSDDSTNRKKENSRESTAIFLGLITLAAAACIAFANSHLFAEKKEAAEEIKTLRNDFAILDQESLPPLYREIKNNIQKPLIAAHERTVSKVNQYSAELLGAVIGGTCLVGGGILVSAFMIQTGIALATLATAGWAYTYFSHYGDLEKNIEDHKIVESRIHQALESL